MKRADRYDSLFQHYAEAVHVGWYLLKAQARAESNFNSEAESPAGAKGLTQFMDPTWAEWGAGGSQFNPEHAISAQARYMKYLLDYFDRETEQALAAYNWGMGNVRKAVVAHGAGFLEVAPQETQDYVAKILKFRDEYYIGKIAKVG